MKGMTRVATAAACALLAMGALSACDSGSEDVHKGAGSAPEARTVPKLDSASRLVEVMPSKLAMGEGYYPESQNPMSNDDPGTPIAYGANLTQDHCRSELRTGCGGLKAMGSAGYRRANDTTMGVTFNVYSFTTEDDAKAAMKAAIARDATDQNLVLKTVKTAPLGDASSTTGFMEKGSDAPGAVHVITRSGTILSETRLATLPNDVHPYDDAANLAKLQNDRLNKVLAGKNPDA
ncbi:hypothetical protein AB0467_12610 [Streptomyces sp. NPDC052095]|uniref:hypothetical protein n=1 Tax=unclassified Streptomyces TaxID=2593676 RepID=UPI00344B52F1